ncbi:MAG: tetratricopeptide repeat protein, partial [Planctomycetes bacterium]|nr:tetratricopeptide repeat protein [Planctomycetota bacterium]
AWRTAQALAVLAEHAGEPDTARALLERAIARYPDAIAPDPARHSGFQHLVNAQAMLRWDRDGYDAALESALERFASDPRFCYFHPTPWVERLERSDLAALFAKIEAGYGQRRTAFPTDVALIERYGDMLATYRRHLIGGK